MTSSMTQTDTSGRPARKPWNPDKKALRERKYSGIKKTGGYIPDPAFRIFRAMMGSKLRVRKMPIRSSYCHTLSQCPRLFMFRVRMGLHLKGYFAKALEVGTFYHAMAEEFLLSPHDNEREKSILAVQAASRLAQAHRESLIETADDTGLMPDATPVEILVKATEEAFSIAEMMFLLSYDTLFGKNTLSEWELLFVETPFEVKVKGITARIRCKPDAVFIRPHDGSILIDSHKTTGLKTGLVASTYPVSLQPQIEHLCVKAAFPDAPAIYYLHNVMQKCTLKFPTKKNPTMEHYLASCQEWYEGERMKEPSSPPILRSFMLLPERPMTEELCTRLHEVSRASSCTVDSSRFYREDAACLGRFGNKKCPYTDLCHSDPRGWPDIIERRFIQAWREDEENLPTDNRLPFDENTNLNKGAPTP